MTSVSVAPSNGFSLRIHQRDGINSHSHNFRGSGLENLFDFGQTIHQ